MSVFRRKEPCHFSRRMALGAFLVGAWKLLSPQPATAAGPQEAGAFQGASNQGSVAVPRFPLRISADQRHLVDANGAPFLVHGDTAWSLIGDLSLEDAALYLDDRVRRGFNTVLVSLLEHYYSRSAPRNAYGESPFLSGADFGAPNPAYFDRAEQMLRLIKDRRLLVLLTPAYIGAGGGQDGWYKEMRANGPDKLRAYGRWLGQRFSHFDNIVWVNGGDYNPPDKAPIRAIAEGLFEADPGALQTVHNQPETAGSDYWPDEPWLKLDTVYTYGPVYLPARRIFARGGRPFIMIESAYEYEHDATEQRLRTQAWQALLCGAAGQVFGNNPIWHFNGPGLFSAPMTWREALNSRGAQSMSHLAKLMAELPWWTLRPDNSDELLAGGRGTAPSRAVAASSPDGSLALVYTPDRRVLHLATRLLGSQPRGEWFDPSSGDVHQAALASTETGLLSASTPGRNAAGFEDWVLVIRAGADVAEGASTKQ